MFSKVYPTTSATSGSQLQSIDKVIASADADIDRITREAEEFAARMLPTKRIEQSTSGKGTTTVATNNNGSRGIYVGKSVPTNTSNYGNGNPNSVNLRHSQSNGALKSSANSSDPVNADSVQPFSSGVNDFDDMEEVKLSHEIANSEEKLTQELSEHFEVLQKQVEEYRKLYQSSATKLKETQAKLNDATTKTDALEEEKIRLEEELRIQNRESTATTQIIGRAGRNNNNSNNPAEVDAMQKRADELRKALLFENEEDMAINLESILQSKNFWQAIKDYMAYYDPFKRDLSLIQARFGSSVVSYFVFYRFLIRQTVATASIALGFFVWHIIVLSDTYRGYAQYFEGTGYLPSVMAYSSFAPSEGLAYDLLILIVVIWTLVSIVYKLVEEDKLVKNLGAFEAENRSPYSKELLVAWDCSRTQEGEIEEFCGSLCNKLQQDLEETRTKGITKARSPYETFIIYVRRSLGVFLFLVTVVTSFAIILYVTVYGNTVAAAIASLHIPVLTQSNVKSLIVPTILNLVNGALPPILSLITNKEGWDSSTTRTNLMLFRLYLASTLNGLLTVLSYLVLADPFLLAQYPRLRRSFGLDEDNSFSCVLDQVAEGLFTLVGFTWAIDAAMLLIMPNANRLLAYLRKKEYVKPEFEVADQMVKRMNFVGLVFASFSFCPMTLIFVPIFLIIAFKYEKNVIKHFYVKPNRPWQGQKAGLVYISFYLASFVLVGVSVCAFFFTTKTFAKNCDIQDDGVHLCLGEVDSTSNVCTSNPSSEYYSAYKTNYPASICEKSCGPFVRESSNLTPLHKAVEHLYGLQLLWDIFLVYPYLPWGLVLALSVALKIMNNSMDVIKYTASSNERSLETQIMALDAEKKRQEALLKKLQSIEATDSAMT